MPKAIGVLMVSRQPITILYTDHHVCNVPTPKPTHVHPCDYDVQSMFRGDGTVMYQKNVDLSIDCDTAMLYDDIYPQAYPFYSPMDIQKMAKTKGYPLRYDFENGFFANASVAKVIRYGVDTYEEIFVSPRFVEDCIYSGIEMFWLETNWKSFFKK